MSLVVFLFFIFPALVKGQDEGEESKPQQVSESNSKNKSGLKAKGKQEKVIDFEDELIQGEVRKPEMMTLFNKKQFNFKRLIKLREDFIPEMKSTAEDF